MERLGAATLNSLIRYAPVWVHLLVYVLSCLVAATLFYFDYRPVVVFVEYFSGTAAPKDYTLHQAAVLWALLLGGPLLFTFGFFSAVRIQKSASYTSLQKFSIPYRQDVSVWMPLLLFMISASLGAYNLGGDGFISKLSAWNDYRSWVDVRWAIFSKLGYFDFVNIYMILPISAAWVILNIKGTQWNSWAGRCAIVMVVCLLNLLLFQKKALIVSLSIIFLSSLFHHAYSRPWRRKFTGALLLTSAVLVALYFIMVVLPVYSDATRVANEVLTKEEAILKNEKLLSHEKEMNNMIGSGRWAHIFVYATLAPMTRSSLPAMYYPIVFPDRHAHYGLDFGQDIIGFGGMPDDNLVIWKNMYPNQPGGSAYGGYQFALYSQVGLFWSLFLCAAVGVVLGAMWKIILTVEINLIFRSLVSSILLVFSIHIAIDSIRNSLVSSYGFIWPLLFISFFYAASWFLRVGNK